MLICGMALGGPVRRHPPSTERGGRSGHVSFAKLPPLTRRARGPPRAQTCPWVSSTSIPCPGQVAQLNNTRRRKPVVLGRLSVPNLTEIKGLVAQEPGQINPDSPGSLLFLSGKEQSSHTRTLLRLAPMDFDISGGPRVPGQGCLCLTLPRELLF